MVHGCKNTRAVLLEQRSLEPVSGRCAVKDGRWIDPYTNDTLTDPKNLEIDHLVPLKEAYQSGAYSWTFEQRYNFANDTLVLVAVSKKLNQIKKAKDVSQWLPPRNKQEYCKRWARIKKKYGLTADQKELETLRKYGVKEDELPRVAKEVNCKE